MTILAPVLGGTMKQAAPAGIQTGADAAVLTGTFDVQAYSTARGFGTIPAETGPTQDPIADQGATGDGVADDTAEVQAAMDALPSTGGVLDLSQGIFGLVRNTDDIIQIGNKSNITIKGGGWVKDAAQTSGIKILGTQNPTGNGFDAALRYNPGGNNQNLVIKDLEIDCNNRSIGGITHQNDEDTWIFNCYIHDVGQGIAFGGPQAAIRGADTNTDFRWIANIIQNTAAQPAGSGTRGGWASECTGCVINHNICLDTAHTGLALHVNNGPTNFIENNTVIRSSTNAGGAGIKPELGTGINVATFDEPQTTVLGIWRRNYVDIQKNANPNNGPWAIQPETMNGQILQNIFRDAQRGSASFTRLRKLEISDNVFELIEQYGIHVDVGGGDTTDKTGLLFNNNTISGDGEGMEFGVNVGSGFTSSNFGFDDPITIDDNLISDATSGSLNVDTDVQNYVNFSESGNGTGGAGATNVLLPPSYAGSL